MVVGINELLSLNFEMKDMDETNFVLRVKIVRERSKIIFGLSRETYVEKVLKLFKRQNAKQIDTLVEK